MVIYYNRKNDVCICHTKTTPPWLVLVPKT